MVWRMGVSRDLYPNTKAGSIAISSIIQPLSSILITECVRPVALCHTLRKQEVALFKWSGSKSCNKVSVGEPEEGLRCHNCKKRESKEPDRALWVSFFIYPPSRIYQLQLIQTRDRGGKCNRKWKRENKLSSDWDWDLGPGTWDLGPGTWDLGPRT